MKHVLKFINCNFCGSSNYTSIGTFKRSDLIQNSKKGGKSILLTHNKFRVVRCNKCTLQFTNPRLSEAQLLQYYEGFYGKKFLAESFSFDSSVYNLLNIEQERGRLQDIIRFKSRGKLLDIGAGPGHFLKVAYDGGWQVFGHELSRKATVIARKQFGITLSYGKIKTLPYPDNFFDVITLHATIEHVLNPTEYLQIAFRKLKSNGLLVMSAPNLHSINFYLAQVLHLQYPGFIFEHLYYFNPTIISNMLKKNAFEIMELTSYHHSRPRYPQSPQKKPQKSQSRISVFLKELMKSRNKNKYIRNRFYYFQMRILREFLEYNKLGGKLQLGDILYVFAQKKTSKI